MHNIGLPKKLKFYIPFIILLVVLALCMPRAAKFNFDYRKGSAWKYEALVSQFDFPIYKTEEEMREELSESASDAIPYYKFANDVVSASVKDAQALPVDSDVKSFIVSDLNSIFSQGVVSDKGVQLERHSTVEVMYIQRDKRAAKYPISEIYKQSEARTKLLNDVSAKFPQVNVDSLFRALDIADLIVPNLSYDAQTTELLKAESVKEVSPTKGYIPAGTLIVSNGDVITAETEQILDSYKREYEANIGYSGPRIAQYAGNLLISLILVAILALVIFLFRPKLYAPNHQNQLYCVMTLFTITSIAAMCVNGTHQGLYFLIPFTLCAVVFRAFYERGFSCAMYAISLLPLLIFANDGAELYVMFLFAGIISIIMYDYFGKGWKQAILACIAFVALLIGYLAFVLTGAIDGSTRDIWYLFLGAMLIFAGFPISYLFERIFNLISENRLEELADTDNKLLRELENTAPGTFQHCLHVMNMADAAARSVGANVPLVRAAALYHDIGKIKNPLCFKENETLLPNESGELYHSQLTPKQSAADIIKHVSDGLELAEQYRLPMVIKNFIKSHHGTSVTSYFYNKYVNDGGDPDDVADFTYPGMKPQNKEQVILMLCDSVEAASRSLKENTPKAYSDLVEGIFADKMRQNQLDEANISIKEINIIKEELKTYLAQMYHERIAYPKRRNIKRQQ